jgi:radical SAM superfamily enzyme YgiQ (UPF0313 family)
VARERGWDVTILDGPALGIPLERCAEEILKHDPALVGFTATTMSIAKAARVADDLRRLAPHLPLAVGGPHVTAMAAETLRRCGSFDIGCAGEGEPALEALLAHLESGTNPGDVPGLVVRGDDGEIIENAPGPEYDLEGLPALAWDLLPAFPDNYHAAATYLNKAPFSDIIVSRGCRYRCTFCDNQTFGRSIRALPLDAIMANIDRLVRDYGIKSMFFTDDSLMTLRPQFEAMCEQLIARDYDLEWSINARTSEIDAEILALMKRAGCWQISYGVESGSWEILKRIKKGATPRMQERALFLTEESGIKSNAYIIIGFPGETHETLAETEAFLKRVPIDTLRLTFFTPFPNTDITDDMVSHGELIADWTKLNFYNLVYIPDGLTKRDLERAYRRIMAGFYLRPKVIRSFLPHLLVPRKALGLLRGTIGLGRVLASGPGNAAECQA